MRADGEDRRPPVRQRCTLDTPPSRVRASRGIRLRSTNRGGSAVRVPSSTATEREGAPPGASARPRSAPGYSRSRMPASTRFRSPSRALRVLALSLAVALALIPASSASAQRRADISRSLPPIHVLSVNPVGLAAGLYSGEYEGAVTRQMSLGVSASYVDFGDYDFTTVDGRWRLYATEVLEGFAFGLSLGAGRTRDERDPGGAAWGVTIGSSVEYQWLLGPEQRLAVGTGVGFKRFLTREDKEANGPRIWPTLRLQVGAAF